MFGCEVEAVKNERVIAAFGGVSFGLPLSEGLAQGVQVSIAIRPEAIVIRNVDEQIPDDHWALEGEIVRLEYLGSMIKYEVGLSDDATVLAISYDADPDKIKQVGQKVKMSYPFERAKLFQKDSQP